MSSSRSPVPLSVQVAVYFRDRWLCHVCRRPVIFHLVMKYLAPIVQASFPEREIAYWNPQWRRDLAPLLDELASSIDHIVAYSQGGAHDESNFATICARCNARKSAKRHEDHIAESRPWRVKGKYGEPQHWDGMSLLFLSLVPDASQCLTEQDRRWHRALTSYLSSSASPPLSESTMPGVDDILDLLDRHHQRATYGAVAKVVGKPATFLMQGRPRDHRHSWVVNQETGLPTGYDSDEMHPALIESAEVISSGEELQTWISELM